MPLVRISFGRNQTDDFCRRAGDCVNRAMVETANVLPDDRFQIITKSTEHVIFDPSYLKVERTDGVIMIQITLNMGRTVEIKKALYRAIADKLHEELGVRREDVLISLVEVPKENWSFGNGEAQYAP